MVIANNVYEEPSMSDYRWTVRLEEDTEIVDMLHEVRDTSGIRMGDLLEQAVCHWFENLPLEDEDDTDT